MKKKEHLFTLSKKDFEVQTFRSGGKGGQHQNKTESGVRIIHRESGAVGESREERSQLQNKKIAFRRLTQTKEFQTWIKIQAAMTTQRKREIERQLDEWMKDENLKVEYL